MIELGICCNYFEQQRDSCQVVGIGSKYYNFLIN